VELIRCNVKRQQVVVAPIGDIQWSGKSGPTAQAHVKRHIERALELDAWFVGMGDYIDFLSPSNRQRLVSAGLYDTAEDVIDEKANELVEEVYEDLLRPTKGRWLGLLEGHHFYQGQGSTSDMWLADMLDAPFLGTSAYIRVDPAGVVLYAHHGVGNSVLPSGPLNKLYHVSHGLHGADVYMIGHTTKMSVARLSRPTPDWNKRDLTHSDIFLVNTGGFSKSSIVGHTHGRIRRGDYAEQKMLTPSPLASPFIHIDGKAKHSENRIRVEI
jgi:hypothetical protein